MRPIEKYLEEVKEKAGIKTDMELAHRLGIKRASICHMKKGDITPSEETCKKLANLVKDPYEKVLLLAQISKASETSKPAWERILKFAAKGGLVMGLGVLYWTGYLSTDETTLPLLGASLNFLRPLDIMSNIIPVLIALPVLMYSLRNSFYPPKLSV